jgi:SSS family solute:Na+ symporter
VLLGVLGSAAIPGLLGPQSNSILVQLIVANAPPALSGLLAAGVLAAIMSSLDSQALALSTLFTRGVGGSRDTGPGQVRRARLLVMAVVALTYLVSLGTQRSIFRLGEWSFTGFAALAPLVFAALYWKRATRAGAYASVITAVVLWGGFYWAAGSSPGYSVAGTGLLPVVVIVPASALALVVVSLVTRPASSATLERFFPTAGAGR